jgi:S-adenosylmethionine synthetase
MALTRHTFALEALAQTPVARRRVELVERKGIGHPDTVCDGVAEAISLALNRMYLDRLGRIPHYNIDKALLVAGEYAKGFGWGEMTRPMELFIGDRATFAVDGKTLPVEESARAAVDAWIGAHLPHVRPGHDLQTRLVLARGSEELRGIFDAAEVTASNDTCGASGYAPPSPTEELVLAVERFLNGPELKAAFPDTGQDIKVFGMRMDERLSITVAMPWLCEATGTEQAYFQRKEEVLTTLSKQFHEAPFDIEWSLNALDRPGRGAAGTYLTLTGTSAEDADSGQVGRGNRANGLIAFSRPSGAEAAPGKNPIAHAGKIYSVFSHHLADAIYRACPGLLEVYVSLATRIGDAVREPTVGVQVVLADGVELAAVETTIGDRLEAELARLPAFQDELLRGEHSVY